MCSICKGSGASWVKAGLGGARRGGAGSSSQAGADVSRQEQAHRFRSRGHRQPRTGTVTCYGSKDGLVTVSDVLPSPGKST